MRQRLLSKPSSYTTSILDIPDIEERKSKFSEETAFFHRKREIAHFHSKAAIDIRLTKKAIKALRLSQSTPTSDWYEIRFKNESDLVKIIELIEQAVKFNKT